MGHFEFIQGSISVERIGTLIYEAQQDPNTGAQDFFLGQIRADEKETGEVARIVFSSYESMATKAMEALMAEIEKKYPDVHQVHILHSLGSVKVGELCMVIFVASGHRQSSFDACRELTERVKKEIPIFGQEITGDDQAYWKKNKL